MNDKIVNTFNECGVVCNSIFENNVSTFINIYNIPSKRISISFLIYYKRYTVRYIHKSQYVIH